MRLKISRNSIRCKYCKTIIESLHTYDFQICACGKVGVDGGREYLKRTGSADDYEELSEYTPIQDK